MENLENFKKIEKMKSELSSELDSISSDLNVAKNNFNYNRHHREYRGDDAYEFDIKMHGAPNIDFEELADEYFGGAEFENNALGNMDFAFREYLVKEVEDFVEMLQNDQKIDWIKDYFQVGRSGGWLVLTLNDYTWSDGDVSDKMDEIESEFHYALDDYSDEGDINLSSIKKEFKKSMEEVDKFRNDADNHISQLQEIEKLIKIAKEEVGRNFKDHLYSKKLEEEIEKVKQLSIDFPKYSKDDLSNYVEYYLKDEDRPESKRYKELWGIKEPFAKKIIIKSIQDKILEDYGGEMDAQNEKMSLSFDVGDTNDIKIKYISKTHIYGEIKGKKYKIYIPDATLELLTYIDENI